MQLGLRQRRKSRRGLKQRRHWLNQRLGRLRMRRSRCLRRNLLRRRQRQKKLLL